MNFTFKSSQYISAFLNLAICLHRLEAQTGAGQFSIIKTLLIRNLSGTFQAGTPRHQTRGSTGPFVSGKFFTAVQHAEMLSETQLKSITTNFRAALETALQTWHCFSFRWK